jgi:hypothetical protein
MNRLLSVEIREINVFYLFIYLYIYFSIDYVLCKKAMILFGTLLTADVKVPVLFGTSLNC